MAYLGFNLLGLIVEGFEEESDLGGLALLVEEDADPLHLGGEVLAAGQREAHVVRQEHPTLRPATRKPEDVNSLEHSRCTSESNATSCCGSAMLIPDPDCYPSRIPYLGSRIQQRHQKRRGKNFFVVLKVSGNEKQWGSGRIQMLGNGLGPWRSRFIYNFE